MKNGIVVVAMIVFAFSAVILMAFLGDNRVEQPVAYNHKIHVQDLEIDCSECHKYYDTLSRAGIPTLEVCADCHSEMNGETDAEAKVVEHVNNETSIQWRHVNNLPTHVYFSHMRHVKLGRIECSKCHGAIDELEKPVSKPYVNMKMSWCLDCHQDRGISNDCLVCHI